MSDSCHVYEWVMTHTDCGTHLQSEPWVKSNIWMTHVTYMNGTWHTQTAALTRIPNRQKSPIWRYDVQVRRNNARRCVGWGLRVGDFRTCMKRDLYISGCVCIRTPYDDLMGEYMYENRPIYIRFRMYSDTLLRHDAEVRQNNLRRYVGWRV